jgi:hypothetical protein
MNWRSRGREGYRILVEKPKNHPVIFIVGRDERGVSVAELWIVKVRNRTT